MADPSLGKPIDVNMTDPRWHHTQGWEKYTKFFGELKEEKIEIHYVYNKAKNWIDDLKFKEIKS